MKKKLIGTIGIMVLALAFTACGKEQPSELVINQGDIAEEETTDSSLDAPDEEEVSEKESEKSTEKKDEKKKGSKKKKDKKDNELVDGMRPEFKEAMDSYEEFFDEYCKFMKKYSKSSDPSSLLADYVDYMAKYADYMEKMEKLGKDDLNDEELKYYTKVTMRINEKLLDVATD